MINLDSHRRLHSSAPPHFFAPGRGILERTPASTGDLLPARAAGLVLPSPPPTPLFCSFAALPLDAPRAPGRGVAGGLSPALSICSLEAADGVPPTLIEMAAPAARAWAEDMGDRGVEGVAGVSVRAAFPLISGLSLSFPALQKRHM